MAKVKGPSISGPIRYSVLEMSGSVGNVTYDRNQYAQYARNRTTPIDPKSPAQLVIRSRMRTAVAAWHSLSDAQRASWAHRAHGRPLTGFNLFIQHQLLNP